MILGAHEPGQSPSEEQFPGGTPFPSSSPLHQEGKSKASRCLQGESLCVQLCPKRGWREVGAFSPAAPLPSHATVQPPRRAPCSRTQSWLQNWFPISLAKARSSSLKLSGFKTVKLLSGPKWICIF